MRERVRRPAPGSLLRHRDFLLLWSGQTVSELGSQISLLAIPLVAVITLRATTFEVGALEGVQMAPFLLIGLPAGAIVDWLPMRPVMIAADAVRLLALGSVPIAGALGGLTLAQLYAVAFVAGTMTVFFDVAYQSYLPTLVGREHLTDGNAKLIATQQIASIAGPAASGALVGAVGAATAVAADAASYFVSVLSLAGIRRGGYQPKPREGRLFEVLCRDVAEGMRYVLRDPMLRQIAGCTGSSNLTSSMAFAVLTVFMVRRLHLTPAQIGGLFAIGSVAGLLGALLAGRICRRIGYGPAIVVSVGISSLGGLVLPLAGRGAAALLIGLALAVFWFFAVVYNVGQVSLRQTITPDRLLGRMNATMRFLVWGTMPVGALVGGALGASLGLRTTLWVAGGVGLVSPLFVLFSPVRRLRELPESPVADEPDLLPSAEGPVPTG